MPEIEISKYAIRTWIQTIATGEFHYASVLGLNKVLDPKENNKLRNIIHELVKDGICESVGRRDGYYRAILELDKPIDFSETVEKSEFPVIYPFGLRRYVFIYPNTVTIVAGAKSSGKTGWCYRVVEMNMHKMNTVLLSNMEGGKEQMYDRFKAMGVDIPNSPMKDKVYHKTENFHDFVKEPQTLYVIDYIDCPDGESFYLIGAAISKVSKKLGEGSHAVIGLQKPTMRDTAFGGEQTLKDAALYIAMNDKKLKIVDAKVPAQKHFHPKNMQWSFKYDDEGTTFTDITQTYEL